MTNILTIALVISQLWGASSGQQAETAAPPTRIFAATYNTQEAAQDVWLQLNRFQWKNLTSLNTEETCQAQSELTEGQWNRICEKAFGSNSRSKGIVHTRYLDFILKSILTSEIQDQQLVSQLMWMKKHLNTSENPDVALFLNRIDWAFTATTRIFDIKYSKNSPAITTMVKPHVQDHTSTLLPFTPDESMMIYLACLSGKLKPNNLPSVRSDFLRRAVVGKIPAASLELGAIIQRAQAANNENEEDITPANQLHEAARLYRKAISERHPHAYYSLASLLEQRPEVATTEESRNLAEFIAQCYRASAQKGNAPACNNYALLVEDGLVSVDEYGRPIHNINAVTARLSRKAVRGGDANGLNGLAVAIVEGKTNLDEYGDVIPPELRIPKAMATLQQSIAQETEMGYYNYAYFVGQGLFKKDENGHGITPEAQHKVAGRLYQKAASIGHKSSLNALALMIYNGHLDQNEKYKKVSKPEAVKEALRMLALANYTDAWLNWASISVEEADITKLDEAQKLQLYQSVCQKLANLPESANKSYVLARAAVRLNPSDFIQQVGRAMELGSAEAFLLMYINKTKQTEITDRATSDAAASTHLEPDDQHLDFPDDSEDETPSTKQKTKTTSMEAALPALAGEPPLEVTLPSPRAKPISPERGAAHKAKVQRILEENMRKVADKKQCFEVNQTQTELTWSREARAHLDSLELGQRKERLPLLIEALKEVDYSRKLIRELKHEKATGQTVYYGNLSSTDRLECTRQVRDGKVIAIHVLGLKGHHTAATGAKRRGE